MSQPSRGAAFTVALLLLLGPARSTNAAPLTYLQDAAQQTSARALLDAHAGALGSAQARESVNAVTARARADSAQGAFQLELQSARGERYRVRRTPLGQTGAPPLEVVVNGATHWTVDRATGAAIEADPSLVAFVRGFDLPMLVLELAEDYTPESGVSSAEFAGRMCRRVRLRAPDGSRLDAYFDADTQLLAGLDRRVAAGSLGDLMRTEILAWRDIGGLRLPARATLSQGPRRMQLEFEEIELGDLHAEVHRAPAGLVKSGVEPLALTPEQWADDVRYVVERVQAVHPEPFLHVARDAWRAEADALLAALDELAPHEIPVRIMQLVARLRDGHTHCDPVEGMGFDRWFPLRVFLFGDELRITAIHARHAELVGARVIAVGGVPAGEAARLASSVMSTDNEAGVWEHVYHLSHPAVLQALGLCGADGVLELDLETRDGERRGVRIDSVPGRYSTDWGPYYREVIPPLGDLGSYPFVTVFPGHDRASFLAVDPNANRELPLHLRSRAAYWFEVLEDHDAVYMQFNNCYGTEPETGETFTQHVERLFATLDERGIERFILDLRFNYGGNGDIHDPFVKELLRRHDSINRPGRFHVLVGRGSFSATQLLLAPLRRWTEAVFVGEPAGAPYHHCFGDPTYSELPNSGMRLGVSTLRHQASTEDPQRHLHAVDVAAPFSFEDYAAGRDPALEVALSGAKSIPQIIHESGTAAAREEFERRARAATGFDWWRPFPEKVMNNLGYVLFRAGRFDDATTVFELNAQGHPDSWNVWDSLAEVRAAAGRREEALEHYRRALELHPTNFNAAYQRERVRELEAEAR